MGRHARSWVAASLAIALVFFLGASMRILTAGVADDLRPSPSQGEVGAFADAAALTFVGESDPKTGRLFDVEYRGNLVALLGVLQPPPSWWATLWRGSSPEGTPVCSGQLQPWGDGTWWFPCKGGYFRIGAQGGNFYWTDGFRSGRLYPR